MAMAIPQTWDRRYKFFSNLLEKETERRKLVESSGL
jgi:hypothetical protein